MTYTYPPEEYVKQLRAYFELEKLSFSPDDSREFILSKLEERSAKKRVIADIANTMVREYIETFEKDPEALGPEDAEKLNAIYLSLTSGEYGQAFPDSAVTLRIARILKEYYQREGDLLNYVTCLYCASLNYMMLIQNHSTYCDISPFIQELMDLKDRYKELPLKQRMNVIVSFSNAVSLGMESFQNEKITMDRIWNVENVTQTLAEQEKTLDLEEKEAAGDKTKYFAERSLQYVRYHCLNDFCLYCYYNHSQGRVPELESNRQLVYAAVSALRSDLAGGTWYAGSYLAFTVRIITSLAEFFLGDISFETLLEALDEARQAADADENQINRFTGLGSIDRLYMQYVSRYSGYGQEKIADLCRARLDEGLPNVLNFARKMDFFWFNRIPLLYVTAASFTNSFSEFADIVLELTVCADKALYIHTVMVREMSRVIFDHMIETTPDFFAGVAGRDAAYVRSHKEEMRALLDDCCMFHDLGKFFMIDITENSMRRLTDDEFKLIQEHPLRFNSIYEHTDESDERFICIHDCALTHHLWHDGTRGYPRGVSHTKNRPFTDIIAIADSLDAATDFLGRPYNSGKTIDQLITEFQDGAGTRYGPEAAEALSSPEVRDKLQYMITEGRKDIYYRIYAFNKI